MNGDGATEQLLGEAVTGLRAEIIPLTKFYPQNPGRSRVKKSWEPSLRCLSTDSLDLYLLHWRGGVPLTEVVDGMEALVAAGEIRRWGVANLDTGDVEELVPAGGAPTPPTRCYTTSPRVA